MINVLQKPWTPEEDELLRKLAKAGTSVPEIAKHIDRSRGSIRDHALKLNITLAKGQRGPKVKR
jgi:DNA-binding NarL/FixJ family response regulator